MFQRGDVLYVILLMVGVVARSRILDILNWQRAVFSGMCYFCEHFVGVLSLNRIQFLCFGRVAFCLIFETPFVHGDSF